MQSPSDRASVNHSELYKALAASRVSFLSTGVFSFFINILLLAPIIYMLEVYDRVLTSNSESTLLVLSLLLIFLFLVLGVLEWVRSQVLIVTGNRLEYCLGPRVFDSLFGQSLHSGGNVATVQPLADLLTLRQFLGGAGLMTLFDAPWLPIYLALMYLFHPLMGVVATLSAIILIVLAFSNEKVTREDLKSANALNLANSQQTQRNLRNIEAIEAMGMLPKLRERWWNKQQEMIEYQARASRRGGVVSTLSKTFRMLMQSMMLGLGAYLAIQGEISGGVVIAGSILLGRALAPIDRLIGTWKIFLDARRAYGRLEELLALMPQQQEPMPLPPPRGEIHFKNVYVTPAGAKAPIIKGINFTINPSTAVAVIGSSGAGKSTLVRTILGLYPVASGSVRLDGAELNQWNRESLGEHVGYLPQDVELLEGTVSENIARFSEIDPAKVIAAASAAGVHKLILRLPDGYDTLITPNLISAGERQRIGLARALYDEPKLVVLDEPNSNLDSEGDQALVSCLQELKRGGTTLVVVTHRNNLLGLMDKVIVLSAGQLVAYDTPSQVMSLLQGGQETSLKQPQYATNLVRQED